MFRGVKMRQPSPHDYDSDWDYEEACEAYRAYLDGEPHSYQPIVVRQRLAQHDPDSNQFVYD